MATGIAQPALESGSRAQLTKLVYAALFLIATSVLFYVLEIGFLIPDYYQHLTTRRFGLLQAVETYLPLTQSLFFLVQSLFVVVFFFRPLKQMFDLRALLPLNRSVLRNTLFGFSTGLITLLATLPVFLGSHRPSETVVFVANHFYRGSGLVLALMLVFLLPVATEILFHGILLRLLLENISVVAALIVSTLLFTLSWSAFNIIAGAALGLTAGILFYKTRSVLACAIANASFTVSAIMLQIWRLT